MPAGDAPVLGESAVKYSVWTGGLCYRGATVGWIKCVRLHAVEHTRAAPHVQSVNASNASAATRDSALQAPLTLHAPGLAITRRLGLFQACSRSALKAQRHPDGNSIVQVE